MMKWVAQRVEWWEIALYVISALGMAWVFWLVS